jgi:hypothetical protein
VPSWGIQLFGGAAVFADETQTPIFADAVARMQKRIEELAE